MSPPIDIDGSEIQDATIDGQDVSKITIDGQQAADLSGIPDSALTQELVAWYRFEDGDGRDYASNAEFPSVTWGDSTAYNGTVNGPSFQSNGGVRDFVNGTNSGAFNFDGSDDEIDTGNNGFTSPISLTGWGRNEGGGEPYFVNAYQDTIQGNFFFLVNPAASRVQLTFYAEFGETTVNNTNVTHSLNNYHHYAFTYDSTSGLDVYVDGNNIGSASPEGSWSQKSPILIGEATEGSRYWDGDIDDVRVYNTKLSDAQIADIYNQTDP